MAKRKNTQSTSKTVTTKSADGQTTTTMTTKDTSEQLARRAPRKPAPQAPAQQPKKKGNGGIIAAIILGLIVLGVIIYFLMNPFLTPAQQRGQFLSQLSAMQSNNQSLAAFYLDNAPNYGLPTNRSWSVQVTDQDPSNSTPVGQLTVTWRAQSQSLSILSGIVNTGISPTYAVTLTPSEFEQFTQAVITRDTAAAVGYYTTYFLSGRLQYTRIN